MSKLAFCDYHNMVAILEKTEHNTDFHQIVDFLEASPLRYALLVRPTIYVSHIRQFWSTARIETADGETHIIAKINGKQVTVSESSIRRKLKLKDEEGISDLPDTDLFANLSRMGYNILPNQRFSFQKGQFTHQWKFLIHTIMQCLSPKSTAFNEFSSNIATAIVCLATNRIYNFSKMIFDGMITNIKRQGSKKFLMYPRFLEKLLKMSQFGEIKHTETYPVPSQTAKVFTTLRVNSLSFSGRNVDLFESMLVPQGEGPVNPTEPHHTPSPQASFPQSQEPIPHKTTTLTSSQEPTSQQISTPSHTPTPRRLTKRAIRIAQSKALTPGADEPASPPRDDSHGEAFPTATSLDAGQDRENIPKTSAMPHESSPRVTSLGGDEGKLRSLEISPIKDHDQDLWRNAQLTRSELFKRCSKPWGMMDQVWELLKYYQWRVRREFLPLLVRPVSPSRELEEELRKKIRLREQSARAAEIAMDFTQKAISNDEYEDLAISQKYDYLQLDDVEYQHPKTTTSEMHDHKCEWNLVEEEVNHIKYCCYLSFGLGLLVIIRSEGPFIKELRENTFAGNRDDDTYEHVQKVLEIVDLFSISSVDHDAIMLRVFPKTLKGTQRDGRIYYH
ncbi:hypothetical protein Tco_1247509 [Tanacetum coccineum]